MIQLGSSASDPVMSSLSSLSDSDRRSTESTCRTGQRHGPHFAKYYLTRAHILASIGHARGGGGGVSDSGREGAREGGGAAAAAATSHCWCLTTCCFIALHTTLLSVRVPAPRHCIARLNCWLPCWQDQRERCLMQDQTRLPDAAEGSTTIRYSW